jgi:hypothetical protein
MLRLLITCTVHFIDKRTWILHRFALGIFKKTGASKAEDVVSYCHILELITKVAMKDYEMSEGTMATARALVGHFSNTSQAEHRLLSLQQTSKPVKCIQDAVTHW